MSDNNNSLARELTRQALHDLAAMEKQWDSEDAVWFKWVRTEAVRKVLGAIEGGRG